MPYQNIDAGVNETDLQAIKADFANIKQKLPFLVSLTVDERRATFRAGPDSMSFLTNAATAVRDNKDIFPASFDSTGFLRDVELLGVLVELSTLAGMISSQIDDTRVAVGGEAMQGGSQVYKYVTAAAKITPGLKPLAEQLGERFRRASKKKDSAKQPPKE